MNHAPFSSVAIRNAKVWKVHFKCSWSIVTSLSQNVWTIVFWRDVSITSTRAIYSFDFQHTYPYLLTYFSILITKLIGCSSRTMTKYEFSLPVRKFHSSRGRQRTFFCHSTKFCLHNKSKGLVTGHEKWTTPLIWRDHFMSNWDLIAFLASATSKSDVTFQVS